MRKILFGAVLLGMIVSTATAKWIDPPRKACTRNGGKLAPGGICKANWQNAKNICRAVGGRLATINELRGVVTNCGGEMRDYENNKNDPAYQSCYKKKGFDFNAYWSSTRGEDNSNGAWLVFFLKGDDYWFYKDDANYVRCVRPGQ